MRTIAFLKVGKITHYYDKIGVGVIRLTNDTLHLGDMIKIKSNDDEFIQEVKSLQVEHQEVDTIKAGDDAGIKLEQAVRPVAEVYKDNG